MPPLALVYYSSTGHHYNAARAIEEGAVAERAEVRLRKVRELAPEEVIASRPAWKAHRDATSDVPKAALDDLDWADGFVFGSPTRFGLPAAQLKQFIDQCGGLWAQG